MKLDSNQSNGLLSEININKNLLLRLAKNDIKSRYAGSFFGILWAFVQPLITLLVFWFVFQIGFKSPPVSNIPFILWFVAGYIPWVFFNDGVLASTNCLYEYHYLVKMIKFPVINLPVIKIFSSLFIHLFFICFIFIFYWIYGYSFNMFWMQSIYYSVALMFLMMGLAWFVSSISVFFKDFSQIVGIILQVGFWATPIFWSPASMNSGILQLLKLNPLYYIIDGYRDSFINNVPFWSKGAMGIYYWVFTAVLFLIGYLVFKRLQSHFADII